jgi:hypothetical protein
MMTMSERSLMVTERGAPGPTDPSRKIMRLTAISRTALSRRTYRGRLALVIAVSVLWAPDISYFGGLWHLY